jgi:hypothetical protein
MLGICIGISFCGKVALGGCSTPPADTTPGGAASALLMEDNTFGLLLEDGTSYLLLEG